MVFPLIPLIAVGLIATGTYGIGYKTGKSEANSKEKQEREKDESA